MTKQKAKDPKLGEVWINKYRIQIPNIVSIASMIKHHRVIFDSNKEAPFIV